MIQELSRRKRLCGTLGTGSLHFVENSQEIELVEEPSKDQL